MFTKLIMSSNRQKKTIHKLCKQYLTNEFKVCEVKTKRERQRFQRQTKRNYREKGRASEMAFCRGAESRSRPHASALYGSLLPTDAPTDDEMLEKIF